VAKKKPQKASDLEYLALHLESLTELLIERGVFTRQDLVRTMKIVDLDDDAIDGGLLIAVMRRALRGKSAR
jgi:hypothetical protein